MENQVSHILTHSEKETEQAGEKLARRLSGGVVALFGDLGAGKTAFVRGMCRGVGYTGEVSSPTFAVVHEYLGGRVPLYHFDMYRVRSVDDLASCGYFDYLPQGLLAVEWSENIRQYLPPDAITVTLCRGGSDADRMITIQEAMPDENPCD